MAGNIVAFFVYGIDKLKAKRNCKKTKRLHILGRGVLEFFLTKIFEIKRVLKSKKLLKLKTEKIKPIGELKLVNLTVKSIKICQLQFCVKL